MLSARLDVLTRDHVSRTRQGYACLCMFQGIWRSLQVPFNHIHRSTMSISTLTESRIPILSSIPACRTWRQNAFDNKKSVGFVPTMGALHDGHLSLGQAPSRTRTPPTRSHISHTVRRSLHENDLTVVSIFVNPAQFALHEDLGTYPRTLPQDLEQLARQQVTISGAVRTPSAVFLPGVQDMYPSGIDQDVALQKGTFVEVKEYSHQMEGTSRPHFFRGVATIVTKLFNVVQVRPLLHTVDRAIGR